MLRFLTSVYSENDEIVVSEVVEIKKGSSLNNFLKLYPLILHFNSTISDLIYLYQHKYYCHELEY